MGVSRLFSCMSSVNSKDGVMLLPLVAIVCFFRYLTNQTSLAALSTIVLVSSHHHFTKICLHSVLLAFFLIVGCQVSETSKSQIHHESALTGVAYQRFER